MRNVLKIAAVVWLAACAPGLQSKEPNPCSDPQYVALKDRPVDQMSEREYHTFMELKRACDYYQYQVADRWDRQQRIKWGLIVTGGFVGLLFAVGGMWGVF